MQEHNIHILCTRPIEEDLVEQALLQNIRIDTISLIETEPIQSIEVQQEVELASIQIANIVFTSMNAVEAVTDLLDGAIPEWRIYCIGHATKELIDAYFGEDAIAGIADNAAELAEEILQDENIDEIIFFCGNKKREELSKRLQQNNIHVNEIVVYQTHTIAQSIEKKYDAVIFFSPSAAESFFSKNRLSETAIVFAIGTTTRETIQQFCKNKIIVSKYPSKQALVEQAIDYFTQLFN